MAGLHNRLVVDVAVATGVAGGRVAVATGVLVLVLVGLAVAIGTPVGVAVATGTLVRVGLAVGEATKTVPFVIVNVVEAITPPMMTFTVWTPVVALGIVCRSENAPLRSVPSTSN